MPNSHTQREPQIPPPNSETQSSAERARVLLELLKERRSETAVAPLVKDAQAAADGLYQTTERPAPSTLRDSARELLERIGRKTAPPAQRKPGAMPPKVVRSTIAALVNGDRLAAEHPAVIAVVIENQPRSMQTAVMRALPGRVARRVRTALLALKDVAAREKL